MEYNPHAENYRRLEEIIKNSNLHKDKMNQELNWYDATDIGTLKLEIENSLSEIKQIEPRVTAVTEEIAALSAKVKEKEMHIGTILNPLNWFSSEQTELRREREQLKNDIANKEKQKQIELTSINTLNNRIKNLESNVNKHNNFDRKIITDKLDEITTSISLFQKEFEAVAVQKRDMDLVLGPIIAEMKNLESRKENANNVINQAKYFDSELSRADNSYERAIIHERCERELGEGSPKKIINKQERIIKQIVRDYQKAQKRALEIGYKAARVIDTLIIDGNNMCYESGNFVGLFPLKKVTIELQKRFKVIVIFDSDIRSMLKSDENQIAAQFGDNVTVHVVASRQKADETILDLASNSDRTYIISNDRFKDYIDKEVVRNNRMIRHEIVDKHILIHDLNINVAYSADFTQREKLQSRPIEDTEEKILDIASASYEELLTLPGIGAAEARILLKKRESGMTFGSIDEISELLNLKPHIAERLKERVKFSKSNPTSHVPPTHSASRRGRVID